MLDRPARPAPDTRMDIDAVLSAQSTPQLSSVHAVATIGARLDVSLPPPLSATSAAAPSRPPTKRPAPMVVAWTGNDERLIFSISPQGLSQTVIATCPSQHFLPFIPQTTDIELQHTGTDDYHLRMLDDYYGDYYVFFTKKALAALNIHGMGSRARMCVATSSLAAAFNGVARSVISRNQACTMIDTGVYVIWTKPHILTFIRGCFEGRRMNLLTLLLRIPS